MALDRFSISTSKGAIDPTNDAQWRAKGTWGERRFQQWNGPLDNMLIPSCTAKGFTECADLRWRRCMTAPRKRKRIPFLAHLQAFSVRLKHKS
jgi:hypothetical protein